MVTCVPGLGFVPVVWDAYMCGLVQDLFNFGLLVDCIVGLVALFVWGWRAKS